jgi:site-specific DNA recombinase
MSTAIYVRVSTERQTQAQTIEQQIERLRRHLTAQGEALQAEDIFRDESYSGATLNRPGLDRLRDQVKAARVTHVVIVSPDRLARNYVHQMVLLEEFAQAGCRVEFLERPMSEDPHDQLLLQIRGAVAEYERTLIAERMRRGRQMRIRAGTLLPWTTPPFGSRLHPDHPRDPATVQLDPTEAAVVHEIFARYLTTGGTLLGVAKYLWQLGVRSPKGNARWTAASVRGVLTNPVYTGQVYVGRRRARPARRRRSATHPLGKPARGYDFTAPVEWTLVATVPRVIGQEQFEQVQAKLALNKKHAVRNNKAHRYLLRALVSCGLCQSACLSRTTPQGHSYYMCRCSVQPLYSQRDQRCHARYSPASQLDALVWQDLGELLTHPESLLLALDRAQGGAWLPQELQARRTTVCKATASVEQQLERLTDAYLHAILSRAEYQRRRQDLERKLQTLATQAQQLAAQMDRRAETAGLATSITDFCHRVQVGLASATFEQKRTLVELLIDRVLVANGEVEIRYVLPTHPRSEKIRFCHLRKDYF